jgi:hypothetical protein
LLDACRESVQFTFDEYKVMLSLQSGVDPSNNDDILPGVAGDYMLQLIELQQLVISVGD